MVVTRFLAACGGRLGAETEADRVYSLPSTQSGSSQLSWPRDERRKGRGGARSPRPPFAFPPFRANQQLASALSSGSPLSLALRAHTMLSRQSPNRCCSPCQPLQRSESPGSCCCCCRARHAAKHATDLNKRALLYVYPAAVHTFVNQISRGCSRHPLRSLSGSALVCHPALSQRGIATKEDDASYGYPGRRGGKSTASHVNVRAYKSLTPPRVHTYVPARSV